MYVKGLENYNKLVEKILVNDKIEQSKIIKIKKRPLKEQLEILREQNTKLIAEKLNLKHELIEDIKCIEKYFQNKKRIRTRGLSIIEITNDLELCGKLKCLKKILEIIGG